MGLVPGAGGTITQELELAPKLVLLLSSRGSGSDGGVPDVLVVPEAAGTELERVVVLAGLTAMLPLPLMLSVDAVAPPGSELFPRCLGGVFLNNASLILPDPPPLSLRLLLLCLAPVGRPRGSSLVLLLMLLLPVIPPSVLPLSLPFRTALFSVSPPLLLLRAREDFVVPIIKSMAIG